MSLKQNLILTCSAIVLLSLILFGANYKITTKDKYGKSFEDYLEYCREEIEVQEVQFNVTLTKDYTWVNSAHIKSYLYSRRRAVTAYTTCERFRELLSEHPIEDISWTPKIVTSKKPRDPNPTITKYNNWLNNMP